MTYSRTPGSQHDRSATGQGRDVLSRQAAWLEQRQPAYLVAALGRPGSAEWRGLALEIERYRRGAGITSRACALGALPGDTAGAGEWLRLAGRIARYQGVNRVGFEDLCVFPAEAERLREQAALSLLEDRRWLGALAAGEIQTIIRMPTLVLRRHVSFAVGLLRDRPADRSARLSGVEAELVAVRANQGPHQAAVREASARLRALRGRSPGEPAQRDLEALIALERDPPAYLKRELGGVPDGIPGQVAWRDGARLIERYRAEYNVDYPTAALGPPPSGQAAGLARQQVAQAVQALKVELHRGAVVRDPPGELPEIDLGPALP